MIYVTWLEKGQEEPNVAQFEDYDAAMLFCKVKGLEASITSYYYNIKETSTEGLDYTDFYNIAKKLNEMNGNTYTKEEVRKNAYIYLDSYKFSLSHFCVNCTIRELCKEIDYDINKEDLTIEKAEEILKNFLENGWQIV